MARSSNLGDGGGGGGHTQQVGHTFGLGGALNIGAAAYRTLSTVLVCPYFGNPDIGLLAAAVFLSIFNVYRVFVRNSVADSADSPIRFARTSDADLTWVLAAVEDEFSYFSISTFDS